MLASMWWAHVYCTYVSILITAATVFIKDPNTSPSSTPNRWREREIESPYPALQPHLYLPRSYTLVHVFSPQSYCVPHPSHPAHI